MSHPKEVDIARGIRMIEWLKAELVDGLATLFKALVKNSGEMIGDALATIIMTCYFLGKRLGVSFQQLDQGFKEKLRSHLEADHQLEKWYGDISGLLHYMDEKTEERNNW